MLPKKIFKCQIVGEGLSSSSLPKSESKTGQKHAIFRQPISNQPSARKTIVQPVQTEPSEKAEIDVKTNLLEKLKLQQQEKFRKSPLEGQLTIFKGFDIIIPMQLPDE